MLFSDYKDELFIEKLLFLPHYFGVGNFSYPTMPDLNRLKVVLVEQKKSGKWLADQLGKSTCTVSKWCSNTVQPEIPTLDKISRVLNVSIKDLLVENIKDR